MEGVFDTIHILHDTIAYDATPLERDHMDYAFRNYHFNRIIRRIILRPAFAHGYSWLYRIMLAAIQKEVENS